MSISDAEKLELYNGALLAIGELRLAALTDDIESRYLLDGVWDRDAVDTVLKHGQWNFAMRVAKMEYNEAITPDFGYQRAFNKPSDLIKICAVCSDEFFNAPLLQYRSEGAYWYAEIDELFIKYVSNDTVYGTNKSLWGTAFTRYVETWLGSQIIWKLTQNDTATEKAEEKVEKLLIAARSEDAMEDPTVFPPVSGWVLSRSQYSSRYRDRGNRHSIYG